MAEKRESIPILIRNARRSKGLTQSELARLVGCRQSAISMFEGGHADALAKKTIMAIGEKLSISPELLVAEETIEGTRVLTLKYCPVDACPSNIPYVVRDEVFFKPSMSVGPSGESTRCGLCGELLEETCPNAECDAALAEGSFCRECGTPYVARSGGRITNAEVWAERIRSRISELQQLSKTRNSGTEEM